MHCVPTGFNRTTPCPDLSDSPPLQQGGAALAFGGVAAKPWRLTEAEESLTGLRADAGAFHAAAHLAMTGAHPLAQNAFKVDLGRHSIVRALTLAAVDRGSEGQR